MAQARPTLKPTRTAKSDSTRERVTRARERSRAPAGPRTKPAPAAKPKRHLPVVAERQQVGCLTCGLCCTYLAVGIDGPSNAKSASEILWHLYHEGISVYRDGDNEWMVQFESRCRHLLDDNKCGIYEQRPHICRDYSEESCEVNADGVGITFYAPDEFLDWLAKHKKRVHKAIMEGYVPAPNKLRRLTRPVHNPEPFETRFNRLRALGAPQPR